MHGGDIYSNSIKYDYSVSLNPLGCPKQITDAVSSAICNISHYPDTQKRLLKESLHKYTGADCDCIVCANGASEIFMAIVNMIKPLHALIPAPSFSGYERALCTYEDCRITEYSLMGDLKLPVVKDVDAIFICNPNNPTGRAMSAAFLCDMVKQCAQTGTWIVVDESFAELSDNAVSLSDMCCEYERLIVVRAFTKLFAMPGVRFGYAIANHDTAKQLERFLPEWNVSVLAEAAALEAVRVALETDYIDKSIHMISNERKFLSDALNEMGIEVFPSDTCFILFRTGDDIYDWLLKKGILIRDCSDFRGLGRGYYRIGIRNHADNELLIDRLGRLLNRG